MCWGHLCEIGFRSEARSLPAVWAAMKELGSLRNIACRWEVVIHMGPGVAHRDLEYLIYSFGEERTV